jgi:hypothetical protein
MLKPIEEDRDAFSGPIRRGNVPYDTSAIREKWLIQAKVVLWLVPMQKFPD